MIYALIILAITNVGTLALFGWYLYLEQREKQKTINALISKSSQEFLNAELSDKMDKVPTQPQTDLREDLKELGELTDSEFDEKVLQ